MSRKLGRNYTKVLVIELEKEGQISRPIYNQDKPNRLLLMFFIYPLSIRYLRLYYKVIIINCTYKINSARILLFKVISINTIGKSFYISFKFLLREIEEDLIQALRYLKEILRDNIQLGVILTNKAESIQTIVRTIFPKQKALLCLQYINKSITKHYKSYF